MDGESVQHPDKVITFLLSQLLKVQILVDGGGNATHQSSPSSDQGGININGQLRQAGVSLGP